MKHPLDIFGYCPRCGKGGFAINDFKSKRCSGCGFTLYFNAIAAAVAVIVNERGELLVSRRAKEPAKGTLDLPGGFIDSFETGEEYRSSRSFSVCDFSCMVYPPGESF